jgi:hypothetical protein
MKEFEAMDTNKGRESVLKYIKKASSMALELYNTMDEESLATSQMDDPDVGMKNDEDTTEAVPGTVPTGVYVFSKINISRTTGIAVLFHTSIDFFHCIEDDDGVVL